MERKNHLHLSKKIYERACLPETKALQPHMNSIRETAMNRFELLFAAVDFDL